MWSCKECFNESKYSYAKLKSSILPGSNECAGAEGGAGVRCGGLVEPLLSEITELTLGIVVAARVVSCGIFGDEEVLISPLSLAAAATAAAAEEATRLALVAPDEPA